MGDPVEKVHALPVPVIVQWAINQAGQFAERLSNDCATLGRIAIHSEHGERSRDLLDDPAQNTYGSPPVAGLTSDTSNPPRSC